jgi:hypothetical protein
MEAKVEPSILAMMVKIVSLGALILVLAKMSEKRSFLMPSFVPIARLGRVEIPSIRERSKPRCALLAKPISV